MNGSTNHSPSYKEVILLTVNKHEVTQSKVEKTKICENDMLMENFATSLHHDILLLSLPLLLSPSQQHLFSNENLIQIEFVIVKSSGPNFGQVF